jgi:hypothetical protein
MGNLFGGDGFRVAERISLLSNRVHLMFSDQAPQFARPFHMRPLICGTLGAFLAICVGLPVDAQDGSPLKQSTPNSTNPPATLTGKERLGRKWMDEQRIDNCNVPIDKRGSRPRPSVCPHVPMG